MKNEYSICLADNHTIFREGIKALISSNPQYNVISEAEDGKDVIEKIKVNLPDLLILDLSMPRMNGIDAIKQLKSRFPGLVILVLTIHDTEAYIHEAFAAGADGYLLKDSSFNELLMGIETLKKGNIFLGAGVSDKIVNQYLHQTENLEIISLVDTLTPREKEIIKLIAEAFTNKKIADYLCISIKTVEKHRANLMKKLNLHNVAEITTYAIAEDLIEK